MSIYPQEPRFRPARQLDDSERNQLRELAHEACEWHCNDCGACDWEYVSPGHGKVEHFPANYLPNDENPYCDDCADHYYQQKAEQS